MLLNKGEQINVILHPINHIAKNACFAEWSLLNTHLWPTNREIVSNFVFSKVAVLNQVSAKHASLTNTDQIEITLSKNRVLLNSFTSLGGLLRNGFKNRQELLFLPTDYHAFSVKMFSISFPNLSYDFDEVIYLAIDVMVAAITDSVVNQRW